MVTDTWLSMGQKEQEDQIDAFMPFQVNKSMMKVANKEAVFMHCLPASRGKEVSDDVIDDDKISLVWEEAENRLHIQKAILEWCLNII